MRQRRGDEFIDLSTNQTDSNTVMTVQTCEQNTSLANLVPTILPPYFSVQRSLALVTIRSALLAARAQDSVSVRNLHLGLSLLAGSLGLDL